MIHCNMDYKEQEVSTIDSNKMDQEHPQQEPHKDKKPAGDSAQAFCALYPFITILRVIGLLYVKEDSRFKRYCSRKVGKTPAILGFIYCCTILVIQWLDFFRSFLAYRDKSSDKVFSSELYSKIFGSLWGLQCATYASFLLKISYKDELFIFINDLEEHYNKYTGTDKLVYGRWLKFHIYGWTLSSTVMIAIMSSSAIYFLVAGYADPDPFPREGAWGTVSVVFLSYVNVMGSCIVFFTICLFAIVCGIVYKEFVITRENLESIIQCNASCGESNLRRIRQRHQNLCSMVKQGNDMFSGILAILYAANIFMACFMSYNLLDAKMATAQMVVGAIWTFAAFLNFLGISVLASFLNSALQMFTARLTGPQIGFTVYDLFVINRPTILTVAGMFLTYFFLLLQFRSPQAASGVDIAKSCSHCLLNFTIYDNSSSVNCSFI